MADVETLLADTRYWAEAAAPATPAAGSGVIYLKSDGIFYTKNDAGTEIAIASASGAPSTVDYLVGTSDAGLSAEIVVGTTPGGELGGTWASPTVDATHAGSTHLAFSDLGTTSVGASDETGIGSASWLKRVTPAAAGLITNIRAHVKGTGGAVDFGLFAAIYDDNASAPGKIIAVNFPGAANGTGVRFSATYRWVDVPINHYAAASTAIWLCFGVVNWDSSNFSIAYAAGGSDYTAASSAILDASITAPSSTTRDYSLSAKLLS